MSDEQQQQSIAQDRKGFSGARVVVSERSAGLRQKSPEYSQLLGSCSHFPLVGNRWGFSWTPIGHRRTWQTPRHAPLTYQPWHSHTAVILVGHLSQWKAMIDAVMNIFQNMISLSMYVSLTFIHFFFLGSSAPPRRRLLYYTRICWRKVDDVLVSKIHHLLVTEN